MTPVTTPGLCFFLSRLPCPETTPAMKCASPALFSTIHVPAGSEVSETLHESTHARIQRIVSCSHASPDGCWYDQPDDEWVAVLEGGATLEFEGGENLMLGPGDHIFIPRHKRHRVRETATRTVWLAVHLKPSATPPGTTQA